MIRTFVLSVVFFFGVHAAADAAYIETFDVRIDVREDGSFAVTETIDYRMNAGDPALTRTLPRVLEENSQTFFRERVVDINVGDVVIDGTKHAYTFDERGDAYEIIIDAPPKTPGQHTYIFTYTIAGGLSFPRGQGAEFYWNVIGDEWNVPMRVVTVALTSETDLFRTVRSCYRGTVDATTGSCAVTTSEAGIVFKVTDLMVGEGMIIAQSLDHARVAKDIHEQVKSEWYLVLFLVLSFSVAFRYGYRKYYTQDSDEPVFVGSDDVLENTKSDQSTEVAGR